VSHRATDFVAADVGERKCGDSTELIPARKDPAYRFGHQPSFATARRGTHNPHPV